MEKSMTGINDLECVRMQDETGLSTRYMEDLMMNSRLSGVFVYHEYRYSGNATAS